MRRNAAGRRAEGSAEAPPSPPNPAIPRDPVSGQAARTAREEIVLAALKELTPEKRKELLERLDEEDAAASGGAA